MSIPSDAEAILRDWREVVSHLHRAVPGTREEDRLRAEFDRLRDEYHRLGDEAVRAHEPALPGFPTDADPP